MFKQAFQRGRSERRGDAYPRRYVELLSDARTKLEGYFNTLLHRRPLCPQLDEVLLLSGEHGWSHENRLNEFSTSRPYRKTWR